MRCYCSNQSSTNTNKQKFVAVKTAVKSSKLNHRCTRAVETTSTGRVFQKNTDTLARCKQQQSSEKSNDRLRSERQLPSQHVYVGPTWFMLGLLGYQVGMVPKWVSYLGPTWVSYVGPTWEKTGGLPMWVLVGSLMGNECMGSKWATQMGPIWVYQMG